MAKLGYAQRIKSRIQQLDAMIKAVQLELDELRVAERVLGRLGNEDDQKGPDDGQHGTSTTRDGTVAEMAIASLIEIGPSSTATLLQHLQQTWREDLKQTTLASTLSRTKGEGQVFVVDGKWSAAPGIKEPPVGGPSLIGSDVDASDADVDTTDLF